MSIVHLPLPGKYTVELLGCEIRLAGFKGPFCVLRVGVVSGPEFLGSEIRAFYSLDQTSPFFVRQIDAARAAMSAFIGEQVSCAGLFVRSHVTWPNGTAIEGSKAGSVRGLRATVVARHVAAKTGRPFPRYSFGPLESVG